MRLSWIILVFFCFASCSQTTKRYKPSSEVQKREKLVDEILGKIALKFKNERGLLPCGSGGGTADGVRMLALSFNYFTPIGIAQGRELLLEAVNEFASTVNADERIRPYLCNFPFGSRNIQIRIFLQNPDGSEFSQGMVCVVSAIDGILDYTIRDPETGRLRTIYTETFEDALRKV